MQLQFDEKVDKAILKSVKATQRFYKELTAASLAKGEKPGPPTYEAFTSMARGLMQADKQVNMDKLRGQNMRDLLERTWTQKLLNYSTNKLLKDSYESLLRRI